MAVSIKNFVVDASFVLAFLMPDESDADVDQYFDDFEKGKLNFLSTPLLLFEVANSLKMSITRKRINLDYAEGKLNELLNYAIDIEAADYLKVLQTSHNLDVTVYDAAYLYLAKSKNLKLLTLDQKLAKLV